MALYAHITVIHLNVGHDKIVTQKEQLQLQLHYISYQVNREKCSKPQWNISDLADLCSTCYIIFLKLCLCQHFLKPTCTDITGNANYFYIMTCLS